MIRLFDSQASDFLTNGLGAFSDASKCEVTEERNGSFELEMEYPVSGKHYPDLKLRRIIVAKPNPYDDPQPFRIYHISKPMNGLITVRAEHISYDMAGYPVASLLEASTAADALSALKSNSIVVCPFEFFTDITVEGDFKTTKPASMRALLGGTDGSILDVYGGEYKFDMYRVLLRASRGADNGITIRYGKNMTDLTQEEKCSNVYTAVYPYFVYEEDSELEIFKLYDLPEKLVSVPGTFDFVRIYPLDVSEEWKNSYELIRQYPSNEEIRTIANKYISENGLGVPEVSLTVSFELLSKSKEYEILKHMEAVRLCDIVHVQFPKLGIDTTAKCIKTTYDAITDKYISVELGQVKSDLANTIVSQNQSVNEKLATFQDVYKRIDDLQNEIAKIKEALGMNAK